MSRLKVPDFESISGPGFLDEGCLTHVPTPRAHPVPGVGYALQGSLTGPHNHTSVAWGNHDDRGHGFLAVSSSCGRENKMSMELTEWKMG